MNRIEKSQNIHYRLDDYDVKKYSAKRKKLRSELDIGEKVYILVESIKMKSALGKFYKQFVQNISYFNREKNVYYKSNQIDQWNKVLLAEKCSN